METIHQNSSAESTPLSSMLLSAAFSVLHDALATNAYRKTVNIVGCVPSLLFGHLGERDLQNNSRRTPKLSISLWLKVGT
jgi:hypothetical protein